MALNRNFVCFIDVEGNTVKSMNVSQRMLHKENDIPEEQKDRRRKTRATARKSKYLENFYAFNNPFIWIQTNIGNIMF